MSMSAMQWYYAEGDQQRGPVSAEEFQLLVAQGRILDATLIWRTGLAQWKAFREVADAPRPGSGIATADTDFPAVAEGTEGAEPCLVCHRPFVAGHLIPVVSGKVCIHCRPVFIQRLREGLPANPSNLTYANFWERFAALFIDGLVLSPINIGMTLLQWASSHSGFFIVSILLQTFAGMLYFSLMHGSKKQATLGKMALGIRVICPDGRDVTFGRAIGRYFASILSQWTLYVGYLMYFTDPEEHRTLHDRIAGTRVIRKR